MAEFAQSKAARAAIKEATREHLQQRIASTSSGELARELAGTSDRKSKAYLSAQRNVNRWKAAIAGSASERRKPKDASLKKMAQHVPGFKLSIKADFAVGDDPKYLRKGKDMAGVRFNDEAAQDFLEHALDDPDEAYQDFFDQYVIPSGTIENPRFSFN